jgi:tripeptide aminopeptidase
MQKISKEKIRDLFIDLVSIDSPSGHEEKVAEYIIKRMKANGFDSKKDSYGNVITKIAGKGESLMLSAHMDTVEPGRGIVPKVKGDWIVSAGNTILGADDKAGIAEIISAIEYVKEQKIETCPLEIVFTREEELGLDGAENLDISKLKSKKCIVLDKSGADQVVVMASPFITSIKIEVIGKSAHSSTPERGINALKIASNAISKLKLGRIDSETTVNIGILNAGSVSNAVPENVSIKAEARSHDRKKMEAQVKKMKEIFQKEAKKMKGKLIFKSSMDCHGYKYEKSDPLVKMLAETWQKFGKKGMFEKVGGASDVNVFVKKGLKAVDISYGGDHPHTKDEKIRLSSMQIISEFLVEIIRAK